MLVGGGLVCGCGRVLGSTPSSMVPAIWRAWRCFFSYCVPPVWPHQAQSRSLLWGRWEEGVTEPQGLQRWLCRKHTMSSFPPGHSLIQLCPSTSQGQRQRQELLNFLFNGHWKNSGLISPNSLHPSLFGDFGFSEGTRTMVLCHWSAIQTSRCVSSIYPPLVSSGHVLPCEDSSSLGSAGEGGRPHGNRRSLPTCARGRKHL